MPLQKTPQNPKKKRLPKCPICEEPLPYDLNDPNPPPHFPFCSERCRLVDLHKWLAEEYYLSSPMRAPDNRPAKPSSE